MTVFVDTSAFYASLIPDDLNHSLSIRAFQSLDESNSHLVTTNYILLECTSLLQRRHGFSLAAAFIEKAALFTSLKTVWIDENLHRKSLSIWNQKKNRNLSFVDCASFAVMNSMNIRKVVGFDSHFSAHGFEMLTS